MSNSLRSHELQHTRPPCPSPTPGVYPNPCPLSQWCHPTISSSVIPFSSCPQSFPATGSVLLKKKKKKNFSYKPQFKIVPLNLHSIPPHHVSCGHLIYEGTDGRDVFWKHLERKIKANPRNYNVVKDLWMWKKQKNFWQVSKNKQSPISWRIFPCDVWWCLMFDELEL